MFKFEKKKENDILVLMPIDELEIENYDNKDLYVLYRCYTNPDIEIGMLSKTIQEYAPSLANIWSLEAAYEKAYFYDGGLHLYHHSLEVTDRPVYEITPSRKRTVAKCEIINDVYISLDDIVSGRRKIEEGKSI